MEKKTFSKPCLSFNSHFTKIFPSSILNDSKRTKSTCDCLAAVPIRLCLIGKCLYLSQKLHKLAKVPRVLSTSVFVWNGVCFKVLSWCHCQSLLFDAYSIFQNKVSIKLVLKIIHRNIPPPPHPSQLQKQLAYGWKVLVYCQDNLSKQHSRWKLIKILKQESIFNPTVSKAFQVLFNFLPALIIRK